MAKPYQKSTQTCADETTLLAKRSADEVLCGRAPAFDSLRSESMLVTVLRKGGLGDFNAYDSAARSHI